MTEYEAAKANLSPGGYIRGLLTTTADRAPATGQDQDKKEQSLVEIVRNLQLENEKLASRCGYLERCLEEAESGTGVLSRPQKLPRRHPLLWWRRG